MSAPSVAPAWLDEAAKVAADAPADRVQIGDVSKKRPPEAVTNGRPHVPSSDRRGVSAPIEEEPTGGPTPRRSPADERDIAYREYYTWTLLPGTAALLVLTVAVPLIALRFGVRPAWVEIIVAGFGSLWMVQLIRWAYRVLVFGYRLTTHRLERRLGPLYSAEEPFDLATIARVVVRRSPFARLTDTGTIRVFPEGKKAPAVLLLGIHRPDEFAAAIEDAVRAARERAVVVMRVEAAPAKRV